MPERIEADVSDMDMGATLRLADLPTIVAVSIPLSRRRVVVKRRRHDAPIGKPDWQILGRSVRFDVYRGTASAEAG